MLFDVAIERLLQGPLILIIRDTRTDPIELHPVVLHSSNRILHDTFGTLLALVDALEPEAQHVRLYECTRIPWTAALTDSYMHAVTYFVIHIQYARVRHLQSKRYILAVIISICFIIRSLACVVLYIYIYIAAGIRRCFNGMHSI